MTNIFSSNYKIYINHTDAGGIVYHGNYLTFYENCRSDWFAQFGFLDYGFVPNSQENEEQAGYYPVVTEANIRYRRPILLDMMIDVRIDSLKFNHASIIFEQSIYHKEQLLSTAKIKIACVKNVIDKKTGEKVLKSAKIPQELVEKMQGNY